jgi:outer membrane protein
MMKILLLILLTLLGAGTAGAQDAPLTLTLNEAISLALEESHSARTQRLNLLEAEQNVRAARGRFKTQLGLELDAPNYNESVQGVSLPGELPQYTTYGSREWRTRLTLRQPLPTDGSIGLDADVYHRTDSVFDDATGSTRRSRTLFNSYQVSFSQPLLVPNTLKLSLERARLNLEESRRNYTAAQLDIVYQVTSLFYEFLRAERALGIAADEVAQQEESYQLARTKYEAGLIPEVEALQMEVDLAQSRNDLLSAQGRRDRSADRFKLVVGLPLESGVAVTASTEPEFFEVDDQTALAHALAQRAEIRNAEADLRRAEITMAETDARSAIRGDLRAYYDLTGVGRSEDDLGLFDLWDLSLDDLERRPGNKGVVFTVSIPIWDSGVNGAEVAAARAALDRRDLNCDEQRRLVTQEVKSALTVLRESRARLEVLQRSVEVARRGLDISLQRFANGDITGQELALDRDRLTQARLAYLDAFISFQLAGADLKRQTLYDFAAGRSLVAE